MSNFHAVLPHLIELRKRLLICIAAFLITLVVLLQFSSEAYTLLATPLLQFLPANSSMIATEVASPLLTPFKLALYLSLFIIAPVIIQQIWAFVVPALYPHEKRAVFPLLLASVTLFYSGLAFAYYVVLPLVFQFFIKVVPSGVLVMTDISAYLDFVVNIFFAFGIAFQCPIVTFLLSYFGVLTPQRVKQYRPYIVVVAFTLGMLLTPPDVISQTLLALPMWFLFESGCWLARVFYKPQLAQ